MQGCQIFSLGKIDQMTTKYTKWPQNIPNGHKIYQTDVKRPNGHNIQIPIFSTAKLSKIYPNWNFWFEKYTIWQPCTDDTLPRRRQFFQ
jgi:hypothetical protein